MGCLQDREIQWFYPVQVSNKKRKKKCLSGNNCKLNIWGSHNKPQRMPEFIFWPYFLLHLSKLAGINIFQYNKHSLFLLFGFQSCIWEWISIFHWSFQRLADSYVLSRVTLYSMDKISAVIRPWLWSASKCFIPSVNPVQTGPYRNVLYCKYRWSLKKLYQFDTDHWLLLICSLDLPSSN